MPGGFVMQLDRAIDQMQAYGLRIEGVIDFGRLVRVPVEGDTGRKKSGWYFLNELRLDSGDSVAVGAFGNWKGAEGTQKLEWDMPELSDAERERIRAQSAAAKEAAEAERLNRAEECAQRASKIWMGLPPDGNSDYLARKKVSAFGLGFSRGSVVVPLRNARFDLVGLQFIAPDGSKKFLTGTPKKGAFHFIGESGAADAVILIAEGYATAASLHMASGFPVAVAFDAGNLLPVAKALLSIYPNSKLIICGDNDFETDGNPGLTKAQQAADTLRARWCAPPESLLKPGGSDFNDVHVSYGLKQVRSLVQLVVEAEPVTSDEASPAPSESGVERPSIEQALQRYALAMPDAKVWDAQEKKLCRQTAVKAFLGKPLFDEWMGHADRRTVMQRDIADEASAAQAGEEGVLGRALRRYVYLYPTDSAWDEDLKEVVPLSGLRYALADSFDQWLKHPRRRQCNQADLVFDPLQRSSAHQINTYRGLPLEPQRDDDRCQAIRHLVYTLCNQNDEVWQWLCRWLAYPLQNVGAKMATAVLMHSETHGSGKSLLFEEVIKPIYGEYGATLGQHQLESSYTDWRSRKLFALFEEVLSRDSKYSQTGTLKHMITGKTQRIEKKFVAGWEEANHMNAVFLSNEVQPFPLEPSDRRFCVIWPNNPLSPEMQAAVSDELANGGVEAFYSWLLRLPFDGFHPHTKPPMNDEKERLIDFGRASWDTFHRDWQSGNLDVPYISCLTQDLFEVYERWCQSRREHVVSHTKFSGLIAARERKRRDIHYDVGIGRKKGAFFIVGEKPSDTSQSRWLGDCVDEFQKAMGADDDQAA